jgi:hypothetical protein
MVYVVVNENCCFLGENAYSTPCFRLFLLQIGGVVSLFGGKSQNFIVRSIAPLTFQGSLKMSKKQVRQGTPQRVADGYLDDSRRDSFHHLTMVPLPHRWRLKEQRSIAPLIAYFSRKSLTI